MAQLRTETFLQRTMYVYYGTPMAIVKTSDDGKQFHLIDWGFKTAYWNLFKLQINNELITTSVFIRIMSWVHSKSIHTLFVITS